MKRLLHSLVALALLSLAASPAFAQKGRGPGSAAGGPRMSAGHGGASDHAGNTKSGSMDAGKKTPDQLLSQNKKLSDKLGSLLPKGMTAQQACSGFKNLGQCVAAIHVSHNLGLDFNCLKADMTGTAASAGSTCAAGTGSKKMSLGQSIHALKPGADAKSESKKASKQAGDDLKESESSS